MSHRARDREVTRAKRLISSEKRIVEEQVYSPAKLLVVVGSAFQFSPLNLI